MVIIEQRKGGGYIGHTDNYEIERSKFRPIIKMVTIFLSDGDWLRRLAADVALSP